MNLLKDATAVYSVHQAFIDTGGLPGAAMPFEVA
jgi:hypothetical protein